jgi:hypothetical protein
VGIEIVVRGSQHNGHVDFQERLFEWIVLLNKTQIHLSNSRLRLVERRRERRVRLKRFA